MTKQAPWEIRIRKKAFEDGKIEELTKEDVYEISRSKLEVITKRLEVRDRQIRLIQETNSEIGTLLSLDEMASKVHTFLKQAFGINHSAILFTEPGRRELSVYSHCGTHKGAFGYRAKFGKGMIGVAAETKKTMVANKVMQNTRYRLVSETGQPLRLDEKMRLLKYDFQLSKETQSKLAVPLLSATDTIGVLYLESEEPGFFEEEDVEAIDIVAAQMATAVGNARLFLEVQERAIELDSINQQLRANEQQLRAANQQLHSEVTDRKQTEVALVASETQFEDLYDNAPDMFVSVDAATARIMQCNQTVATATGYSKDEIVGKPIFEMYHPDSREDSKRAFASFATVGEVRDAELQLMRKDGSKIDVTLNVSAVRDEQGRILRSRSVWRDITEYKRAREELQKSERELAIRNTIANVFLTVTDDQMYDEILSVALHATQSEYGIFGYTDDNGALVVPSMTHDARDECRVVDRTFIWPHEKWNDGVWSRCLREKRTIFSNEKSNLIPEGNIRIDRNIPVDNHITVPIVHQGEAVGLLHVANKPTDYHKADIQLLETIADAIAPVLCARLERGKEERHRELAEEGLREAYTRLEEQSALLAQSEKAVAVGTLVAGTAHELNNPLMAVLNFSAHCRKHTSKDDELYPILEDIEHEAKRCADIIHNLTTFSDIGQDDEVYEKASLTEIIGRVFELLSWRIENEGISTTLNIAQETPDIWMNATTVQQLILNVTTNALDALKDSDKKELNVILNREGEFVRITFADTGCGIEDGSLKSIFDPFFTTKPVGQGIGLGLSASQGIVRSHGGQITCRSEPGFGTEITILLPIEKNGRSKENE